MKGSGLTIVLLTLFSPAMSDAQEIYRATRSLKEQQAVSHISQAEYYARMALRSLDVSEKIGKGPYFNYQNAREDIEKVLTEFNTYLGGDESTDVPSAVPLMVDGRYFAESIKNFLASQKPDDQQAVSNLQQKAAEANVRLSAPKAEAKTTDSARKKSSPDKGQKKLKDSELILPPPAITSQSGKAKRDKIEEILKKGL